LLESAASAAPFKEIGIANYLSVKDGGRFEFSFSNLAQTAGGGDPCNPVNLSVTPLEVQLQIDAAAAAKIFADFPTQPIRLYPGQTASWQAALRPYEDLIAHDPEYDKDHLFGVRLTVTYFQVTPSGQRAPISGPVA